MPTDDSRLRILVIVSRPLAQAVSLAQGGQSFEAISPIPLLAVELVRQGLQRVFQDDETPARVRYLPWACLEDVQAALAEPYDVVHLVGHGTEDGRLLLECADGTADLVAPAHLAGALREAGVRLALLSACYSGPAGRALHQAGIPNVVMVDERYPMHAGAAALFNRLFYARLARGGRPGQAFENGVRAVRASREFGDDAPPPPDPYTGQAGPRYGERFDKLLGDDRPLVNEAPLAGYEELCPVQAPCTVPCEEVFVGREAEMIAVIRQLQRARLVTLHGPGGIGKTALARQVARWHADRRLFRDGVVEVRAERTRDENDLLDRFANALRELSPDFQLDPRQPWVSVRAALAGRRLVLLDSAEDLVPGAVAALGQQLLARLSDLHLLVTSHAPLRLVGYEQPIPVEQLPVGRGEGLGDAERMFLAHTPQRRQAEVLDRHLAAVRAICRELDGYPLGILLEAVQLSDERETPARLLERLRANMVEALCYAQAAGLPARHQSVGAALKGAHEKLGAAAQRLLAHLAVLPGGASEELLFALEGLREAQWREAEGALRALRLATWQDDRYHVLAPIRAWALTTLPPDELDDYRLRAARWLNEQAGMWNAWLTASEERRAYAQQMAEEQTVAQPFAFAQDRAFEPAGRQPGKAAPRFAEATGQAVEDVELALTLGALARFDRERENLVAAVRWADDAEAWDLAGRLAGNLAHFFDIRGLWADWVQTHELALAAARRAGDRPGEGRTLTNLGSVYADQGRWAEAIECHEQALGILRALGDRPGEGQTLTNLGNVYARQGRWAEAIQMYEQSLDIFRALGDRHGEGITLANLGVLYWKQDDRDKAVALWQEALARLHPDSPEHQQVARWLK